MGNIRFQSNRGNHEFHMSAKHHNSVGAAGRCATAITGHDKPTDFQTTRFEIRQACRTLTGSKRTNHVGGCGHTYLKLLRNPHDVQIAAQNRSPLPETGSPTAPAEAAEATQHAHHWCSGAKRVVLLEMAVQDLQGLVATGV